MSSAHPGITVALSDECLASLFALPKGQQGKVHDFIKKFRANPTASGINYEVIKGAKDANLRSVRIDQAYRGIVLAPKRGDVYVMLWVDHHDDAYEWARRRRCAIHPGTGALQVLSAEADGTDWALTSHVPAAPPLPAPGEVSARPLLDGFDDATLVGLGVPSDMLPAVRAMKSEADLDAAQAGLPVEGYEALFLLVAGYPAHEILADRQPPTAAVDLEDFGAALVHPDSQRRFVVVADDEALTAILDAPMERWRVFLHPSQRQLVGLHAKGPVRVLGGAGTGKTVVAMHRAVHLATTVFAESTDRILLTTFTKNLAADLRSQLATLAPSHVLARIDVVNLDAWVFERLRAHGVSHKPAYGAEADQVWRRVATRVPEGQSAAFLLEEFEKVVLPQGLTSEDAYLAAARPGRGTPLGRRERRAAWQVFAVYREALAERGLILPADAMRELRRLLTDAAERPYRAVVVDEAQDLGTQAFLLVRQLVRSGPNDLFLVGDAHQRIYGQKVVLSRCGIEVRGRSQRLRINYRTTDEIRAWAVQLLAGQAIDDLDGGEDDARGYKSLLHGGRPEVHMLTTAEAELYFLASRIGGLDAGQRRSTCLVTRTSQGRDALAQGLRERGISTFVIDQRGDRADEPGVRLATMHRVKGLEFDRVVVAQMNEGVVPLAAALGGSDAVSIAERVLGERALVYVAVTRAKREVLLTCGGRPSEFLMEGDGAIVTVPDLASAGTRP